MNRISETHVEDVIQVSVFCGGTETQSYKCSNSKIRISGNKREGYIIHKTRVKWLVHYL